MRENKVVKRVAGFGQVSSTSQARQATRATLLTLSEFLPEEEAQTLATRLPGKLGEWATATKAGPAASSEGRPFDAGAFLDGVAARLRGPVHRQYARQQVQLVMTALGEAVTSDEREKLAAHLPAEFARALHRRPPRR